MRSWDAGAADYLDSASRNAVEIPPPSLIEDNFYSAYDAGRALRGSDNFKLDEFGGDLMDERATKLSAATGISKNEILDDMRLNGPWASHSGLSPGWRRNKLIGYIRNGAITRDNQGRVVATPEVAWNLEGNEEYADKLMRVMAAADADQTIPSEDWIMSSVQRRIIEQQSKADEFAYARPGAVGAITRFGGMAAGEVVNIAQNPLALAITVAGSTTPQGYATKTLGQKAITMAGREAVVGGLSEVAINAEALRFNQAVGVPYTAKDAAFNILAATLVGAGFGASIPVIGAGVKKGARVTVDAARAMSKSAREAFATQPKLATPEAKQAADALDDFADEAETAPAPEVEAAHSNTIDKAQSDLLAGQPVSVEQVSAPVREASAKTDVVPALPNRKLLTRENIETFDPTQVEADAKLFQFKAGGDETGVTAKLKDVKTFDPSLAGTTVVWERADGKLFIVDGHQRLGLARRALEGGQPPENVFLTGYRLRESEGYTPSDARYLAAFKNVTEGTGSAIDAAKMLREIPPEVARQMPELSANNALARNGRNLARLDDDAFAAVINGVVPEEQGAIVGELIQGSAEQLGAIQVLAHARPANAQEARFIVEQVRQTQFIEKQGEQTGLFGEEAIAKSYYGERARILSMALSLARNDARTFGTLLRREGDITGAGNKLKREANLARKDESEQVIGEISRLANVVGPISESLTSVAKGVAERKLKPGKAAEQFLEAVRAEAKRAAAPGASDGAGKQSAVAVAKDIKAHKRLNNKQRKQLTELYDKAVAALPEFERQMTALAEKVGGRLKMGSLKSVARSVEKILDEEAGDFGKLRDIVRGTIQVDSIAKANQLADEIAKLGTVGPPMRNGYAPDAVPPPNAYRDIKANIQIAGHDAEIQVNLPEMLEAKEKAHPLYEKQRVIGSKKKLTAKDRAEILDLIRQQKELYAPAFETISRKADSVSGEPFIMADADGKLRGSGPSNASASPPSGETATGMPSTSQNQVPAGKDLSTSRSTSSADNTTAGRDLLGDDTSSAQTLADETARRDAERNTGQVDLETGDPTDLFSQARKQNDLFDQKEAAQVVQEASETIAEKPEKMVYISRADGSTETVRASDAMRVLDDEDRALDDVAKCSFPGGI